MNFVLGLCAFIAFLLAVKNRAWNSMWISLGLILAPMLLLTDPMGLFYHSLALTIIMTSGMISLLCIERSKWSRRSMTSALVILIPYLIVCVMKMFQLQGYSIVRWILLLSIVAFLQNSIDRRKWDQSWFIQLFIALSSAHILTQ